MRLALCLCLLSLSAHAQQKTLTWRHLSTATGDLPLPSQGKEQTSLTVADFTHDGRPGFVVTERTQPDSVVLYRPSGATYQRIVIEPAPLHIEAGGIALDVDGDGNLDIFCAEQRLDGANPHSKAYIFFGDGKGNFTPSVIAEGLDFHEAKAADLNADGRIDIVSKPYNYQSPRVDIFLNLGPATLTQSTQLKGPTP